MELQKCSFLQLLATQCVPMIMVVCMNARSSEQQWYILHTVG
jgi:hypothetical protein